MDIPVTVAIQPIDGGFVVRYTKRLRFNAYVGETRVHKSAAQLSEWIRLNIKAISTDYGAIRKDQEQLVLEDARKEGESSGS